MPLYKWSNEQLNYFKFATIVVDEFPKALRQAFVFMWDKKYGGPPTSKPWDDTTTIRNQLHAQEHGNYKIPVHQSYETWDCTALFQATLFAHSFKVSDAHGYLRTLNYVYVKPLGLASSGPFHATVSSSTGNRAESFALAFDQLRRLRNKLFHLESTETMDKASFAQHIKYAKECFSELGQDASVIDNVSALKEEEWTSEIYLDLLSKVHKDQVSTIRFLEADVLERTEIQKQQGEDMKKMREATENLSEFVKGR